MRGKSIYSSFIQNRARTSGLERYYKPRLLVAFQRVLSKEKSVVDLGAGPGRYVRALRNSGYKKVVGIDATEGIEDVSQGLVFRQDLTGDCIEIFGAWDWGLFIDVGEHIPLEQEQQLIYNVSSIVRKGLIVSWGLPGTRGRGHVNCRTSEYIASQFTRRGWFVDDSLTRKVRVETGKYYSRCLMVLVK